MKIDQTSRECEKRRNGIPRRTFLKSGALMGGAALLISQLDWALNLFHKAEAGTLTPGEAYELAKAENIIYSVCLQCHTACPIKAKVLNGVLVKIDGPAYSPQAMLPHIPYATSPMDAATIDGKVCPKGQAGVQSLYDPYRIFKVLKRSGPRGSNQWVTIPFEQAVDEIVNGGFLFKKVKGEEKRRVPGLKELYAVRDADLLKTLADDGSKVGRKQMNLTDFKTKHAVHLNHLIDPEHPDLGPVNNQLVFLAGRIEHGRIEFSKRWLNDAFGSVNWYEHTTICEQSHHIAYEMATNKYANGKWSGGKTHMKPDALNSEFIIYFGTGAFEANFGPPSLAQKVTDGIVSGRLKIAVVDPRFSKTAAKAWKWAPVKPAMDAALVLAMIQWIIENERFDSKFLANANLAAANADGETSWSTASWLVKIDKDGTPGKYLRAAELGIGDEHTFVVLKDGQPVACNPYDTQTAVEGDLLVDTTIKEINVKSAFQLLWESAASRSIDEWAELCGIESATIIALAQEFTSHGKKAVAEFYRGPVQHTNGYYNAQALIALNVLVGNPDWKGGLSVGGGHWHEAGGLPSTPFDLLKALHPGKLGSFGVKLTREKVFYEQTTLFRSYPAKRPFYPLTSNVYHEVLPAARAKYPYPIKALFLHMGTPAYSTPAAQHQLDALVDVETIPLFFACDIVVGESSMYADYIFPDLSIWERWSMPHVTPDVQTKTSKVRQPIVAPLTETVTVFGEQMPISMEAIMLAIAEKLNLPGYGSNGLGEGWDFKYPEDFYLKMVANIAMGDKAGEAVPDADDTELELFLRSRRHLPKTVFDPQRWEKAVGSEKWKKVVYVLNRGGRYEDFSYAYENDHLSHRFGGCFSLYAEPVATTRHSITGHRFSGIAVYEPILDAAGREVNQPGYDLQLVTFKDILGGQSRTQSNYWLTSISNENYILMNSQDARRLGLTDGAMAKLVSATNPEGVWNLRNGQKLPVAGKVKVIEGIRPGTIAVSWHFGHWAYGAGDVVIDNKVVKGDKRRATGLSANVVLLTDPYLNDVCLTDPIGGSASFYDTQVKVIPL